MRLGFDLDGTLADLQSALAKESARLFPDVDPSSLPTSADLTQKPADGNGAGEEPKSGIHALSSRQQSQLWDSVCARTNFWQTLEEIEPGALARLFKATLERRWEVIFLTSRPETAGDTAQAQSHRWLIAHGFTAPSVFVVHGSRGKIASALRLDVVVDDRPENCLDVSIDSKARAILIWRGEESKVPASARQLGIGAVHSINECLDILESLNPDGSDQVSMFDRLKRLLGLKPQASRPRERPSQPATMR